MVWIRSKSSAIVIKMMPKETSQTLNIKSGTWGNIIIVFAKLQSLLTQVTWLIHRKIITLNISSDLEASNACNDDKQPEFWVFVTHFVLLKFYSGFNNFCFIVSSIMDLPIIVDLHPFARDR